MKLDLVAALALGALAIAMRLPSLDTAGELKSDEGFEYLQARAIAREGARPGVGLRTTEGPRVPPHRLYLFAIPLTVTDGPLAIMRFVALLNAAAVPAAFLVGRRDLGRRTALAWALLLAVAPGLVRFSRAIWGPDLLLPISVAVVLALARMKRDPRAVAAALPLATLAACVHYAAAGLAALAAARAVATWGRARRPVALGAALAVAVASPFLAHELASGFAETRAALSVAGGGGRTAADPNDRPPRFVWIVPETFDLVSPHRATEPLAPAHADEAVARVPAGPTTIWLATLALLVACAAGVILGALDLARGDATAASLARRRSSPRGRPSSSASPSGRTTRSRPRRRSSSPPGRRARERARARSRRSSSPRRSRARGRPSRSATRSSATSAPRAAASTSQSARSSTPAGSSCDASSP
jgi:hypothetical protein